MKRTVAILLVTILAFVGILTSMGCQKPAPPAEKKAEETPQKPAGTLQEPPKASPVKATFASGTTGGTWEIIAQGISEAVRKAAPGSMVTVVPGGGVANVERVYRNEVEMAYCYTNDVIDAHTGSDPFKSAMPEIRVLAVTHATVSQPLILTNAGVTSLNEIRDKKYPIKICFHAKGTGPELFATRLFEAHGINFSDIEKWGGRVINAGPAEGARMMKDRQIEACEIAGATPNATVIDVSKSQKVTFLKYDSSTLNSVADKYGYVVSTVPKGTYDFVTEDYETLFAPCVIIVHKDMPDETAYTLAKALHTQLSFLFDVHQALKNYITTPDVLVKGLKSLHPGAEKYYREAGLLK